MQTFQELGLEKRILQAITDLGFETPSEIQQQAIPVLVASNRDFVGLAQTGTGKTAAFGLPLAELVDFNSKDLQAIVVCPTRELCNQITSDLKNFTKHFSDAKITAVYGGASISGQLRELKQNPQIVVATPGRMIDFIERKALKFENLKIVVLDEADEMLNMGFKEDIDTILETTPDSKRVWLFSATMPPQVAAIASNYMTDPFEITVGRKNSGAETVSHFYCLVEPRNRFLALKRILDAKPNIFGLVFTQTRQQSREVAEDLMANGYNADALHGDLSQAQRDQVMARFRSRKLQILVATDVAARGIDVDSISHVIHYSMPDEIENYNHRSGRTGRAGKTGESIVIMSPRETRKIFDLKKYAGITPELLRLPSGKDVVEIQLNHMLDTMLTGQDEENSPKLDYFVTKALLRFEDVSKEDLIKAFIVKQLTPLLRFYENAPNLNREAETKGKSGRSRSEGEGEGFGTRRRRGESSGAGSNTAEPGFQRFFINIGALDQVDRGGLLRFMCDNSKLVGRKVGKIDMKREFSFVEVQSEAAAGLVESISGINYKGREIRMNLADRDSGGGASSGGGSRGPRESFGGDRKPRRDRGSSAGSGSGFQKKPKRREQYK
ncbi:MAG: DEAD/DEAH box helicase [Luteibaculaceae bacterium]